MTLSPSLAGATAVPAATPEDGGGETDAEEV